MEESSRIDSGARLPGASEHWSLVLYPLWQWLVLIPATAIFTVIAALIAIVMCAFGLQRQANLGVAARWARVIAYLTPMRVEIEGAEHIDPDQSYVVVANHQSQYDIPLIYGFCGLDLRWVMKSEIGKLPFIAQGCRAIGHIFIDRGNPDQARDAINSAVGRLPRGTGVLFFPEGTRSRSGELIKFRKGAFRVAVDRNLPVLPMTVIGTRELLRPGSFRIRPGRARLVIHPPIQPGSGLTDEAAAELCLRTRTAIAAPLEQHRAGLGDDS
ncbi:MAG TPA: lysophospholipid acyltransferase family protein [Wenzhouxiangellaceae bacterium]|nr:lysophospholipid acyltransferase family protein [Wenzhouxiangellaceae bacterium]